MFFIPLLLVRTHSLTHSVVYIVRKMLEQFFLRLWMTLGQGEFLCDYMSLTRCVLTLVS